MQSMKAGELSSGIILYGGRATAGKKPLKTPKTVRVVFLPRGCVNLLDENNKLVEALRTSSPIFATPIETPEQS